MPKFIYSESKRRKINLNKVDCFEIRTIDGKFIVYAKCGIDYKISEHNTEFLAQQAIDELTATDMEKLLPHINAIFEAYLNTLGPLGPMVQ